GQADIQPGNGACRPDGTDLHHPLHGDWVPPGHVPAQHPQRGTQRVSGLAPLTSGPDHAGSSGRPASPAVVVSQLAMSAMTAGSTCCAGSDSAGADGPVPGKEK